MAGRSPTAHWTSDLRQTLRVLRRSPGHVGLVIACLGIGLAASIAVFSIVNALLYGEQPGIRDRKSLVRVSIGHDQAGSTERVGGGRQVAADPLAETDYRILRNHGPALAGLAVEGDLNMAALVETGAVGVRGALVSGSYFGVLGTPARLGRLLTPGDDRPGAPPVVVVGDRFWCMYFDGRSDVIGRTLVVSGRSATIVGVAPPRFSGIQPPDPAAGPETMVQLWLPVSLAASWPGAPSANASWLYGIGRLAAGVTRSDAAASLDVAARRIEAVDPSGRRHATIVLRPQGFGAGDSPADVLVLLGLFLSVPLTVLAIACANVANLQLARATDRIHELAVRLWLGATSGRLLRLLTIESLVLALAALLAGGLGAVAALRVSAGWFPLVVSFDWRIALFAMALASGVTIVTGLAPAWLVLRRTIAAGLRQTARVSGLAHARLRSALVVTQVAPRSCCF
jgi:putative ABC transport system permease protein